MSLGRAQTDDTLARIDKIVGPGRSAARGARTAVKRAVGAGGDLYVADSGTCTASGCSGGLVAHVHPGSGARTVVRSGIFTGTLQIAVLDALAGPCNDGRIYFTAWMRSQSDLR